MFMILSTTPQNTALTPLFLNGFIDKNLNKEAVRMDPLSLFSDFFSNVQQSELLLDFWPHHELFSFTDVLEMTDDHSLSAMQLVEFLQLAQLLLKGRMLIEITQHMAI